MQRLFRILDTKTQKFEQDRFENKMDAKKLRNDLNEKVKSENRYKNVISYLRKMEQKNFLNFQFSQKTFSTTQ